MLWCHIFSWHIEIGVFNKMVLDQHLFTVSKSLHTAYAQCKQHCKQRYVNDFEAPAYNEFAFVYTVKKPLYCAQLKISQVLGLPNVPLKLMTEPILQNGCLWIIVYSPILCMTKNNIVAFLRQHVWHPASASYICVWCMCFVWRWTPFGRIWTLHHTHPSRWQKVAVILWMIIWRSPWI